jgi:putative transposase
VVELLNSDRFVDKAPAQIFAMLLDEGQYKCSVRSMYRILESNGQARERRDQLTHPVYSKPELLATGPNQVWSWDITKLLGPRKWSYYYLYVILDVFSRFVVGWLLAHRESASLAKRLIAETIEKQGIRPGDLTLHADRGTSMRSIAVAQLLADLGVTKTHRRPHTSNDNPYSEAQFKTLKFRPDFPERFESYDDARSFCRDFFSWYNDEHRHCGIALMTPRTVHYGEADRLTARRQEILDSAHARNPQRFPNGRPMAKSVPNAVWINPPRMVSAPDLSANERSTNESRSLEKSGSITRAVPSSASSR